MYQCANVLMFPWTDADIQRTQTIYLIFNFLAEYTSVTIHYSPFTFSTA